VDVDFEGGLDLASFRFGLVIIVIGCHVVADVDDNDLLQCLRGSQLPAIPVTGSGFNLFLPNPIQFQVMRIYQG